MTHAQHCSTAAFFVTQTPHEERRNSDMLKQCLIWMLCAVMLLGGAAAEAERTKAPLPELGLTFHLDAARLEALQAGTYGLLPVLGGEDDEYFGRVYAALLSQENQTAIAAFTTMEELMGYLEERERLVYRIDVVRQAGDDVREPFATAGDFSFYCEAYPAAPSGDEAVLALMQTDADHIGSLVSAAVPTPLRPYGTAAMTAIAPFTTTDLNGETVTEEIFTRARLTMVNIWGTYCTPCINEMPDLGKLAQEADPSEFQLVGVLADVVETAGPEDASWIKAVELVKQTGAAYTHLTQSESLYYAALQGVSAVPTTYFVNAAGELVGDPVIGSQSEAAWRETIAQRLAMLEE